MVFANHGLNVSISGITFSLNRFRRKEGSRLLESSRKSWFFSERYERSSVFFNSRNGRTVPFPFDFGMPESPESFDQRKKFINTVSAWSSAVCPVRRNRAQERSMTERRNEYRSDLAESSVPVFRSFASALTSADAVSMRTPNRSQSASQNAWSPSDSSPRRRWLKCAAVTRSRQNESTHAKSSATESLPHESATTKESFSVTRKFEKKSSKTSDTLLFFTDFDIGG